MLLTSVSRAGPCRCCCYLKFPGPDRVVAGGGALAEEAGVTILALVRYADGLSWPQSSVAHRPKGRNQRKRAVITFTWRLLHNTVDAARTWYAVLHIACFARRRFVLKLTGMGKHYMLPRYFEQRLMLLLRFSDICGSQSAWVERGWKDFHCHVSVA